MERPHGASRSPLAPAVPTAAQRAAGVLPPSPWTRDSLEATPPATPVCTTTAAAGRWGRVLGAVTNWGSRCLPPRKKVGALLSRAPTRTLRPRGEASLLWQQSPTARPEAPLHTRGHSPPPSTGPAPHTRQPLLQPPCLVTPRWHLHKTHHPACATHSTLGFTGGTFQSRRVSPASVAPSTHRAPR